MIRKTYMAYNIPKPKPVNNKKYHTVTDEEGNVTQVEVNPTMFVNSNGKKKLCGTANGELIVNSEGNPIPFRGIG